MKSLAKAEDLCWRAVSFEKLSAAEEEVGLVTTQSPFP